MSHKTFPVYGALLWGLASVAGLLLAVSQVYWLHNPALFFGGLIIMFMGGCMAPGCVSEDRDVA